MKTRTWYGRLKIELAQGGLAQETDDGFGACVEAAKLCLKPAGEELVSRKMLVGDSRGDALLRRPGCPVQLFKELTVNRISGQLQHGWQ